jgi:hypothetical protein
MADGRWTSEPDKTRAPKDPIVRLVLKAAVASLEVRKPAGKWEKVAGESYAKVVEDSEHGLPRGLGFEKVPSISMLMQENRDQNVFAILWRPGRQRAFGPMPTMTAPCALATRAP